MDQQRRAEYEECREEIQAWKQEQIKALREAVSAGMPPSFRRRRRERTILTSASSA
jgi:hypothetical protein